MAAPFRLARVLRLRTRLREQAQDEVARGRAALVHAREAEASARAAQAAVRAAEEQAAADGIVAGELVRFRAFERAEGAREARLTRETVRLAEELLRRRDALLVRRREERQLERLADRARRGAEAVEARAAAVLLDDLAIRRRER